jgi:hypothetical protein
VDQGLAFCILNDTTSTKSYPNWEMLELEVSLTGSFLDFLLHWEMAHMTWNMCGEVERSGFRSHSSSLVRISLVESCLAVCCHVFVLISEKLLKIFEHVDFLTRSLNLKSLPC